jgi:acyl carrier protein
LSDTRERLKDIIVAHLGVDASKVKDGARFVDDLGADSIDTSELAMAIEEEFGCNISPDDAAKILTVKDAIAFVETRNRHRG